MNSLLPERARKKDEIEIDFPTADITLQKKY